MSLFDRIFKKTLKPAVSQQPTGLSGPLTLHEAIAATFQIAIGLDTGAKLTFITSGLDLQQDGRSRIWEFICILPNRGATLMLSLEPDSRAEDPDKATIILTKRIKTALPPDIKRPYLPALTRNSPDVVAEFSLRGIDFVAGPSDMKIESRILPSGEAAWVTFYFGEEFTAPFEPYNRGQKTRD
jgi:hypothetical protein